MRRITNGAPNPWSGGKARQDEGLAILQLVYGFAQSPAGTILPAGYDADFFIPTATNVGFNTLTTSCGESPTSKPRLPPFR